MNYIECPNCGKKISTKSNSCIYCGVSRGIIDQEIKTKELAKNKEFSSKVEGVYQNHKFHIIMAELLFIIMAAIIYCVSYLPKILEYSKSERVRHNISVCDEYGGTWNNDNNTCVTEFGNIQIN